MGPGTRTTGEPSDGGGQYCLVCSGSVRLDGKDMPPLSLAFVEPGDPAPIFDAGPLGAEVLVLQFATPSERPGSDPAKLKGRDPSLHITAPRE
jgi:hypothetical protein